MPGTSAAHANASALWEWDAWWRSDDLFLQCHSCKTKFSAIKRRHHCRGCGMIFCSKCSGWRKDLPQLGYRGPQRVCAACKKRDFDEEQRVRTSGSQSSPHGAASGLMRNCTVLDCTGGGDAEAAGTPGRLPSVDLLRNCTPAERQTDGQLTFSTAQDAEGQELPAGLGSPPSAAELPERDDASFVSCEDWDIGDGGSDHDQDSSYARSHGSGRARARSVIVPSQACQQQQLSASLSPSSPSQLGGSCVKRPSDAAAPDLATLPAALARSCGARSQAAAVPTFDFRGKEEWLGKGGSLFSMSCNVGTMLRSSDRALAAALINRSCFADELRDNAVPPVSMKDSGDLARHIFLMVKAQYVLPGVTSAVFTPELFEDPSFHRNTHPSSSHVWEPGEKGWEREEKTFRITKSLIPYILKMTIQFRVSEIPAEDLPSLAPLSDGYRVDKALLLERTKRNRNVEDGTKKAKSVLLYHDMEVEGVLCTNFTLACNTSLPTIAARALDRVGSMGAGEVGITAERTRAHLRVLFPPQ